ncbi:glutaredoxin [Drosophila hydei]|uniref:Glutaredoxin-2, mitochondrial n=1 Tax=Drosophila hydei TaxID=7224 RepID=A0A6J1L1C3_DROHY|nr:glutaredoxin [Drosophila hydei]
MSALFKYNLLKPFKNYLFQPFSIATKKFPFPFLDFDCEPSKPLINMDSIEADFVRDTIAKNKVAIFSKTSCPYCTMAKEPFRKLKVDAMIVELDGRKDGNAIQSVLGEMTGARTVPRVFINGKFVGGGTDIKRMYELGTLQKYFE